MFNRSSTGTKILSREDLLITGINGFVGRGLAAALQGSDRLIIGTEKGDRGPVLRFL